MFALGANFRPPGDRPPVRAIRGGMERLLALAGPYRSRSGDRIDAGQCRGLVPIYHHDVCYRIGNSVLTSRYGLVENALDGRAYSQIVEVYGH